MSKDNKIYVAFGFHVNCYHSYRGDTPDGLGFGSDIRIIRKTIDVLNKLNEQGIPVRGTWDIENFFSLEKILPEYAPDIIDGIRERCRKYGDENIIMGYSNGALGAMTDDELTASIELAVTNPAGSGLNDLFGECEMIVRPQEFMFSPPQIKIYNRCGVKALCLYNSCVPFDAIRTIIKPLPDGQAFNPLSYTYGGDELTVIPTYSNADVCDEGCMRSWVKKLRIKQENGSINRDLFIFVNMDADAIFWETMKLPVVGSKIANTDGIHGLVTEIADLPYVEFSTPGRYIKNHKPVGKITFGHDLADGNFSGFASWSEKPYNRKIWTALDRARLLSQKNSSSDKSSASFDDRVLLLSTTHFGLATPVLNIAREKKADELADRVVSLEKEQLSSVRKLSVFNINGTAFQSVRLSLKKGTDCRRIILSGKELKNYCIIPAEDGYVYCILDFCTVKDKYTLSVTETEETTTKTDDNTELETSDTRMVFTENGIDEVVFNGSRVGSSRFLESFITYGGVRYSFGKPTVKSIECVGDGKAVRLSGEIHLPDEISAGTYSYTFFTVPSHDMIFVAATVNYPYTDERDSMSTENSTLGRFTDMKWTEAVPFALTPISGSYPEIIKRNFSGEMSSYPPASFYESDPVNRKLDSFNNHLTAGLVGVKGKKGGLLVANSRQVLGSMAHCPMRLDADGTVHINPFGTYYGEQRHYPSSSNGIIKSTYSLVTPQSKSIAPSYNGVTESFFLSLAFFDNEQKEKSVTVELSAFADGAVVVAPANSLLQPDYRDNVKFRKTKPTGETGEKLANPVFTGLKGNLGKYLTHGTRAIAYIIKKQIESRG